MKRIKKFVALALAASMVFATASTAFASKNAQTITEPSLTASTEEITIPMIKVDGKWKIDPLFAYIGIKNIKWNSELIDFSISGTPSGKAGRKKLDVDINTKYAPYAILLNQKGTIVPRDEPLKTPKMLVEFWVKGNRQKLLYTRHQVTLNFMKRVSPLQLIKIGATSYDVSAFDTSNSAKFYVKKNWAWRTIKVTLKPYYKNLKLVAIGKDGHNWVMRSTSGRSVTTAVNLKTIKAIQIRYSVDRKVKTSPYYNYLKDGVDVPNSGVLTLNIK
jgi:hypothetical protein